MEATNKLIQIINAYEELIKILKQPPTRFYPGQLITMDDLNGGYSTTGGGWTFTFRSS